MKLVAGQRFYLKNENQFVKAISGKLEVYAVTRNASSFRQIFLLELAEGDAAFPSVDEFGYIDFLVHAVADSEIELIGIEDLPPRELRLLMQNWFAKLVELSWLRLMADWEMIFFNRGEQNRSFFLTNSIWKTSKKNLSTTSKFFQCCLG